MPYTQERNGRIERLLGSPKAARVSLHRCTDRDQALRVIAD